MGKQVKWIKEQAEEVKEIGQEDSDEQNLEETVIEKKNKVKETKCKKNIELHMREMIQ